MKVEQSKKSEQTVAEVSDLICKLLQTQDSATWDQILATIQSEPKVVKRINTLTKPNTQMKTERFVFGVAMRMIAAGTIKSSPDDGVERL